MEMQEHYAIINEDYGDLKSPINTDEVYVYKVIR